MTIGKAILELGRVANLPTVWGNCIAGWILTKGYFSDGLWWLCLGASLLYVGGTAWNDAFDVRFDSQFRKERPVPSGRVAAKSVWIGGGIALLVGAGITILGAGCHPLIVLGLVVAIVLYDWIHKKSVAGVWVMGACRFLLYLAASSAAMGGAAAPVSYWVGGATGLYIVGLSLAARGEATGSVPARWGLLLLAAPMVLGALWVVQPGMEGRSPIPVLFVALLAVWTGIAIAVLKGDEEGRIGKAVERLLAGILLIDASVVAFVSPATAAALVVLFIGALVIQRWIPAT